MSWVGKKDTGHSRWAHLAGLPPLKWRVCSASADLGDTSKWSTQRRRGQALFLKRWHSGAVSRVLLKLERWLPEFPLTVRLRMVLSLLGDMRVAQAAQQDPCSSLPSAAWSCPPVVLFLSLCCSLGQRGEQRRWAPLQGWLEAHAYLGASMPVQELIFSPGWMPPQGETHCVGSQRL